MPTTERTAGRKRDPRTDVAAIDAVLDLVAAGASLSGLSLVTIADYAGVSRNSLYRRWKTKQELYFDVLDAINKPMPPFDGPSARQNLAGFLAVLIERTLDPRASAVLRSLLAEATSFPELYARYFDQVVEPRREVGRRILRQGIAVGELDPGIDVELVREVLVAPALARLNSGSAEGLDPEQTGRRIVDLLYHGIRRDQATST
ncbi:TetR/AcrR family transcriptional regulator [Nocardia terpenica]|uniref:HTH tetR-type domain-containing protein n=1 Tax=Nocardia terpenica TaxID=455432 RepID=A0A164LSB4_9NOCA|nr:TetR/AcrR family transcriptional regulator [Nocardia terpenica]KZM72704.1 hypothetical protein AWN90_28395 [Nocardia terpenica]NQE92391.1 TetR family transcriptional regulator [Nocardia terpenica]